jgi:hypothetical protein
MGRLTRSPAAAAGGVLALAGTLLAACGGGAPVQSGSRITTPLATATTLTVAPAPAGPTPSASAQLICSPEVQDDLGYTLGEKTTSPVRPTWSDHVYACDYHYADGEISLSVKELSSAAETTAFYGGLSSRLGDTGSIPHLGQGAFTTRDGSVVVRKDWRVLLVDVSRLPAEFGSPQTSREDVAITVADVVIACWTGD